MIVFNSSPLIYFGKQGKLDILKKCFQTVSIPREVYDEIMIKKESPESITLEKAIAEKWITIKEVSIANELATKNLGGGEKAAISLAIKEKSIVLLDDDNAKDYATILNVEKHGSLYVLLKATKKSIITKKESKTIFEKMISDGFYVSTNIYIEFLRLLDKL